MVTILGNSLTIAVFTRKNFQRKKLHYLLINLAVTDLITGTISVTIQIAGFIAELHNIHLSEGLYDAHYFSDVLSDFKSAYSVAFISVERLHAVCWPFKHRILKRWHYALTMSMTWLVGATVALASNEILPDRISRLEGLNICTVFTATPIIVTITAYCFLRLNRKGHVAKTRRDKNRSIACSLLVVTVVFYLHVAYVHTSS